MYATYSYNTNSTQVNILNDVVAILTGTTNKTTLSAACDQANTEILTTYNSAGWALHDAAAGTNAVVLKAACDGDSAQYKYVEINTNTAGYILTKMYTDWNSSTHTGTNLHTYSTNSTYTQRYSTTLIGKLFISSDSTRLMLYGAYVGGIGNSSYNSASGILEFNRGYTWCAVGRGFAPFVFISGDGSIACCRFISANGAAQTNTSNQCGSMCIPTGTISGSAAGGSSYPVPMGDGLFASPIVSPCGHPGSSNVGIWISGFSISDIYILLLTNASNLDEVPYNSKTYVCFPQISTCKLLVPKG